MQEKSPPVLCHDAIDAIETRRGGKDDVAEMNRVTIALMQELDRLGNDTILIGTTNRPDTLDDALFRRFTFGHTVRPLCRDDARTLARLFFASVGYSASETEIESLLDDTSQYYTAGKNHESLHRPYHRLGLQIRRIHHASEKFNRRSKAEPR